MFLLKSFFSKTTECEEENLVRYPTDSLFMEPDPKREKENTLPVPETNADMEAESSEEADALLEERGVEPVSVTPELSPSPKKEGTMNLRKRKTGTLQSKSRQSKGKRDCGRVR